jgi:hypothetical protein
MNSNELALSGGSISSQSLEQMSRPMQRQATRAIEKVVAQGLVTNTREQVRALITATALQNVGALSALEEHIIQITPLAAARCEAIVNSYALGASQVVARW